MDPVDKKILNLLQKNYEITIQDISNAVHLSTTPCWHRINKLKKNGYITKTVALLDAKKVNCGTSIFVFITINKHDKTKLELFSNVVKQMSEIVECHRMSGTIDYLLKVLVNNIEDYDVFYKKFIEKISFVNVVSNFSIEKIKYSTEISLSNL